MLRVWNIKAFWEGISEDLIFKLIFEKSLQTNSNDFNQLPLQKKTFSMLLKGIVFIVDSIFPIGVGDIIVVITTFQPTSKTPQFNLCIFAELKRILFFKFYYFIASFSIKIWYLFDNFHEWLQANQTLFIRTVFFWEVLQVFLDPPPLTVVFIGLVQCVSSYTLSSPEFKGVTCRMYFKHTFALPVPPGTYRCDQGAWSKPIIWET